MIFGSLAVLCGSKLLFSVFSLYISEKVKDLTFIPARNIHVSQHEKIWKAFGFANYGVRKNYRV